MSSSKFKDKVLDELKCGMCFDTITDPKVLQCPHTFCLKCLEKHYTYLRRHRAPDICEIEPLQEDELECPTCRQITHLPAPAGPARGRIASLPTNLPLKNVASLLEIEAAAERKANLHPQSLCKAHSTPQHPSYLDDFCEACRVLVCCKCIHSPQHSSHTQSFKVALDVLPECAGRLQALVNSIATEADSVKREQERIQERHVKNRDETACAIKMVYEKMLALLRKRMDGLLEAVHENVAGKLAVLQQSVQTLEELKKCVDQTNKEVEQMLQKEDLSVLAKEQSLTKELQDKQQAVQEMGKMLSGSTMNLGLVLRFEEGINIDHYLSTFGRLMIPECHDQCDLNSTYNHMHPPLQVMRELRVGDNGKTYITTTHGLPPQYPAYHPTMQAGSMNELGPGYVLTFNPATMTPIPFPVTNLGYSYQPFVGPPPTMAGAYKPAERADTNPAFTQVQGNSPQLWGQPDHATLSRSTKDVRLDIDDMSATDRSEDHEDEYCYAAEQVRSVLPSLPSSRESTQEFPLKNGNQNLSEATPGGNALQPSTSHSSPATSRRVTPNSSPRSSLHPPESHPPVKPFDTPEDGMYEECDPEAPEDAEDPYEDLSGDERLPEESRNPTGVSTILPAQQLPSSSPPVPRRTTSNSSLQCKEPPSSTPQPPNPPSRTTSCRSTPNSSPRPKRKKSQGSHAPPLPPANKATMHPPEPFDKPGDIYDDVQFATICPEAPQEEYDTVEPGNPTGVSILSSPPPLPSSSPAPRIPRAASKAPPSSTPRPPSSPFPTTCRETTPNSRLQCKRKESQSSLAPPLPLAHPCSNYKESHSSVESFDEPGEDIYEDFVTACAEASEDDEELYDAATVEPRNPTGVSTILPFPPESHPSVQSFDEPEELYEELEIVSAEAPGVDKELPSIPPWPLGPRRAASTSSLQSKESHSSTPQSSSASPTTACRSTPNSSPRCKRKDFRSSPAPSLQPARSCPTVYVPDPHPSPESGEECYISINPTEEPLHNADFKEENIYEDIDSIPNATFAHGCPRRGSLPPIPTNGGGLSCKSATHQPLDWKSASHPPALPPSRPKSTIIKPVRMIENHQFRQDSITNVCPSGVCCTGTYNNIIVTDVSNHCLRMVDQNGSSATKIGRKGGGDGCFDTPVALAVSRDNFIYVADQKNARIQKFSTVGTLELNFGEKKGRQILKKPQGIAVRQATGDLYVADSEKKRVYVYQSDGTYLRPIGKYEKPTIAFNCPVAVTISKSDHLLVVDRSSHGGGRHCVWCIRQPEEELVRKIGEGVLENPSGIAVTQDGTILVTELDRNSVCVFSEMGELIHRFGQTGIEPGMFNQPCGICVNNEGQVVVADKGNNRVQVFLLKDILKK